MTIEAEIARRILVQIGQWYLMPFVKETMDITKAGTKTNKNTQTMKINIINIIQETMNIPINAIVFPPYIAIHTSANKLKK